MYIVLTCNKLGPNIQKRYSHGRWAIKLNNKLNKTTKLNTTDTGAAAQS